MKHVQLATTAYCVAFLSAVVSGCGPSGIKRMAVEGRITVDGAPLKSGSILFIPQGDVRGPTSGGRVIDGQFRIESERGPTAGMHRIEIRADDKLPDDLTAPHSYTTHDGFKPPKNRIPARYNARSNLVVKIRADGKSDVDFELSTKP